MAILFAGGLLISGFTILRGLEPFDEGLTLQAARRVADGQMPYRDFLWAYGPAHPFLLAGMFKAFGTSLLWWRIIRVVVDAAIAVVVFEIVRREAPRRVALVAWLVAACAMAQPTGANPFAPALLFSLGAVWFAARGDDKRGLITAGGLAALAAAWRLDFGLYAADACTAAAYVRSHPASWRWAALRASGALRRIGIVLGTFAAGCTVVYLPFVIADGPADAWRDLIGRSLQQGRYWRLPFPIGYDGQFRLWPPGSLAHDAKDVLEFYIPLLLVIGITVAVVAIARRRLRTDPLIVGLTVLGFTYVAYLLSRTDEFHSTPLVVLLAVLLPVLALRVSMRGAAVMAFVVAGLLAYGLSNRLSALFGPPDLKAVDIAVADGVKAPPDEARSIEQMVRAVQRRVPAGDPIYAVTRRSDLVRINDPLIYVLTERDNPTRQDFGLQTGGPEQQEIVDALEVARPKAIVRWLSPESTIREPNDRGKPTGIHTLDVWLAENYRPAERYGDYQLLVPR
jgi:Dolichyl-phosphate-mannose-protein mannosyltransferase